MTKVIKIPTSKITQFESKQTPTIKQEKNIIKKDNIGTVVPGDALRNINLSTVPSVVQDAINAMGLSVETNILANALLLQIQRDIDNLGDAIVEKSYIDGQVSYLTSLLGQKSDVGDVASIVDSRIAIVTEDFATTAQVNNLNSRVGESESSITTLNQTINTKDAARATQIEEVEARVNQSLSNYTAVLNLTVDENGNVISQKIESLVAQNEEVVASIEDLNQVIIDKDNEWSAKSIKLITSPTGAITGYSFQDGSGLKSNFTINADSFKIANSTNTYTPFSIVDNNITFNGKVSFSNTTTSTGATLTDVLDDLQNNLTNLLNENNTAALLEIANLDGKIDAKEQELINSINAEASTRAAQITARINAEALLDGKIDAEETARINAATALETTLKNYTDVVAAALIDGEISAAEQNAINEAQIRVNTAKTQLVTMINNLTKVEDINWQSEVQNAINNNATYINGSKVVTNQAFVNNLNAVGGIKASKIDVNNGNGFILNSEATGTSTSPNIQGGYIKGTVLESVSMATTDIKVKAESNNNNFGNIYISYIAVGSSFTTLSSEVFINGNYSSGFNKYRMCKNSQIFSIEASLSNSTTFSSIQITIQVSVNGGAWTTLVTNSSSVFVTSIASYTHSTANSNNIQFRAIFAKVSGDTANVSCILKVTSINGQ